MDNIATQELISTIKLINKNLDEAPDSWREQLPVIRIITLSSELSTTLPDEVHQRWRLPLITTFQRVAFADADNGIVQDVAYWCLRQLLNILQAHPENVDVLTCIGRHWLFRAQKFLANIFQLEQSSSSSEGSTSTQSEGQVKSLAESEGWLQTANYVEARGILHPAVEYFQRAVDTAEAQGIISGTLLSVAAEAHMSLGNVTSSRINDVYFRTALSYLRAAAQIPDYSLPPHLENYLSEYGPLYQ